MDLNLTDKIAVVTGAGNGIGLAITRALTAEGAFVVAGCDLRLVREQIIADGNFLAARTTFSGNLTGVFTHSPIGPVESTHQHLEWEVIGTFGYDADGRLAEGWVQTDYHSFLTKLGVTTTESAAPASLG
jgi:NAD(P)-dependent dehydrogenase (short-subunit alcohol dehydrogenase family)